MALAIVWRIDHRQIHLPADAVDRQNSNVSRIFCRSSGIVKMTRIFSHMARSVAESVWQQECILTAETRRRGEENSRETADFADRRGCKSAVNTCLSSAKIRAIRDHSVPKLPSPRLGGSIHQLT